MTYPKLYGFVLSTLALLAAPCATRAAESYDNCTGFITSIPAVINSQGIMQSPVVREHAGIADDQAIMKSIALGWPDENFPAMRSCRSGSLLRRLRCSLGSRIRRGQAYRF